MAELRSPGNIFQCQLWRNPLVLEGKILKPWILHHVSVVMSSERTLRILSPAAITDPFETLIKKPPQMRWLYLGQVKWKNLWENCL
jgi:hypothetical protein